MSRRFWRLFPVYLFCMVLAIILFNMSVNISNSTTLAAFGPENLERLNDVEQHFGQYLIADATLLQCLLPKNWFPFAHESFLPPTWSLTIEWLFYMVAPFLIWMIKSKKQLALVAVCLFLASLYWFHDSFAAWNSSFNISNAFHFLTGIGSYFVWKHLPERRNCWWTKLVFWGLLAALFVPLNLPYKIWIAMMATILYPRIHSGKLFFLEWPRQLLNCKPCQYLGRTSYVTYLLHWIVIELVLFWVIQFAPGLNDRFALATICTLVVFPLTYLFSHVIHKNLEVPMMRVPKWLSQRRKSSLVSAQ